MIEAEAPEAIVADMPLMSEAIAADIDQPMAAAPAARRR